MDRFLTRDLFAREADRRELEGLPPMPLGRPEQAHMVELYAPPSAPEAPAAPAATPQAGDAEAAAYVRRKLAESKAGGGKAEGGEPRLPSQSTGTRVQSIFAAAAGRPYSPQDWAAMDNQALRQRDRKRAEEDADPASERSQRARAAVSPMLKRLGLSDDEISGLSATDIGGMTKGGDLAMQLAQARAASQAAQQKADAEIVKRDEQRAYEEAQAAGPKFEREKELARIRFGLGADRSIDAALLTDRLQREREFERWQREQDAKGAEKGREGAKDYGVALQKTGIPGVESTLRRVDELAAKLKAKNGGKLFGESDEIIRRSADAVNKPDWYAAMSDPDAVEFMREVQTLRNTQIKDEAGGNVTNSEFGRQQAAMGSTPLNDADAILRWTAGMRHGLEADRENLLGAYGPAAVEQYERNRRGGKPSPAKGGAVRVRNPKTGEERTLKDSPELRERVKSGVLEVVDG